MEEKNLQKALQELESLEKKLYAYKTAQSALYLDSVTAAPAETAQGRGVAMGILAGESQKLYTAPETAELLSFLLEYRETLDQIRRREVEELSRQVSQLSRIPAEEYMEYTVLENEASEVWHKAKETSDFSIFCSLLEKLVMYNRKFAGYYDPEKKPYDALLNENERGTDMERLDRFFAVIKARLVPLIQRIGGAEQVDDSFLHQYYPVGIQRKFSDYLMEVMGLDRKHCAIGETEHPFMLEFNNRDVRIHTHYKENCVTDSMYSVIHESGHARYELGIMDELQYTCLAGGVSNGIHESQSRFYENLIGRSRAFIQAILPKMKELFPEQLSGISAEQMYRAVNKVEPSLIRTEADEVTYCLHILIRYEIEKQLIDGSLAVKDLPAAWNRLYKEYLGLDVPDDKRGCLQDSHWSGGLFGYFPSYALGSAYGAQMLRKMEQELDIWGPAAKGDLTPVNEWLREKIHRFGGLLEPMDVLKNACGEFDPTVYTDYLEKKYSEIYHL